MKASIKLNPTRLVVPKYNNAPMLFLEDLTNRQLPIIKMKDNGDCFEIQLPLTKHSILPMMDYINANLDISE